MADMYQKTALTEAYLYPFADTVPQRFKDAIQTDDRGNKFIRTYEGDSYILDEKCFIAGDDLGVWRIDFQKFRESYRKVS